MVTEAEKSCARLVALIAELSEIGKIDDGLVALSETGMDLFPLMLEVAGSVHEASERGVSLEVRGQRDGAKMTGDSGSSPRGIWRNFPLRCCAKCPGRA